MTEPTPPRWAVALVGWASPDGERDFVVADLLEGFITRAEEQGVARARLWYAGQVVASITPLLRLRIRSALPHVRQLPGGIVSDLIHATRMFSRRRGFAAVAVLALALGVGASTTVFTIVDGILLQPLPYADPDRLVTVWETDTAYRSQATLRRRWNRLWFSYPIYRDWAVPQRSLMATAAYGDQQMTLTGQGEPAEVQVSAATPSLVEVLGATVAFGRWFAPDEVGTNTTKLAVLSQELWRSRFGADSGVIDRYVTLDDDSYRVIGVMPRGFRFAGLTTGAFTSPSIWIPLGSDGGGQGWDSSYEVIGRLAPGATLEQAAAEIDPLVRAAGGKAGLAGLGARVQSRLDAETDRAKRPLFLLAGGVVALLLIACTNIVLLFLGELPARAAEFSTRRALGASTSRLARQLMGESFLIAVAGGVLGGLLSLAAVRAMVAFAPPGTPRLSDVHVGLRAFGLCAGLIVVVAIVGGVLPALAMRGGAGHLRTRAGGPGRRERRVQGAIMAAQVALGVALLSTGVALAHSLQKLLSVESGLRADHVLTMSVTLPSSRYGKPEASAQFFNTLEARLAAVPGVVAVGATSNLPFSERNQTTSVDIDESGAGAGRLNVQRRTVRAGYFRALGIPLKTGRLFAGDGSDPRDGIVIDEEMAAQLWPGQPALGKKVKVFGNWFTVTGIVGRVHHVRLDEAPRPTFYLVSPPMQAREMTVVVRTTGDPLALVGIAREAVWSLDANIPLPTINTLEDRVRQLTAAERYRTAVIDLFAVAAAGLIAVGIFGLTARVVNHRRREIGVRLALGADARSIAKLVVGEQGRSVAIGALIGVLIAVSIAPVVRGLLYQTSPANPLLLLAALAAVGLAGGLAVLPSLRRAAQIDPAVAMREST